MSHNSHIMATSHHSHKTSTLKDMNVQNILCLNGVIQFFLYFEINVSSILI